MAAPLSAIWCLLLISSTLSAAQSHGHLKIPRIIHRNYMAGMAALQAASAGGPQSVFKAHWLASCTVSTPAEAWLLVGGVRQQTTCLSSASGSMRCRSWVPVHSLPDSRPQLRCASPVSLLCVFTSGAQPRVAGSRVGRSSCAEAYTGLLPVVFAHLLKLPKAGAAQRCDALHGAVQVWWCLP